MKKQILLFGVFASMIFSSCSEEETTVSDFTTTDLEVTIEHINFDPATAEPIARFNEDNRGLYHGIIVSLDTGNKDRPHGKIWVNVNNDGNYNATVVTNTGDRFGFIGKKLNRDGNLYSFVGNRGSFKFDVTDFNKPIATNVIIDSKEGHIATLKDRAGQRAAVILGSFQTNDDDPMSMPPLEAITGTWDLMTDGTPNVEAFGFPNLTEVVITITNNGNVYSDTDFETFEYPCFFIPTGPIAPVFLHEDPMTTPNGRNEFWAQDQSFLLGNATLTYWLGQSSGLVDNNGLAFLNHGFHNNDFADPPVAGCNAIDGEKGVWFWNGRSGFSSFDDPFDVPMIASESANYEGFKQMLRDNN